jgi:hypothetical protein
LSGPAFSHDGFINLPFVVFGGAGTVSNDFLGLDQFFANVAITILDPAMVFGL